ncbi:MAG: ATP-binding cassette domain-containing protein [Eubacteriaceae bacterium]|mgnify:CR=1 FL=1|jgi:cobalt/nickel transport system ATP-binding protein|nr:ATP-binding cassette domain-containing protein [Eubacteriaceae bacterium]MDD4507966.1 ATP-binding cassette domain-containing protein [Eubacteriaceae bacterium]
MAESILKVQNLSYQYSGENQALKHVSVDIAAGERICVVGSNGAGKSTFFLNVNGVLTPDAGEIYFKGHHVGRNKKDLNDLRRGIGIVFQDADNQIIASTVMGEVSFGPMNLKLPKAEVQARVDEALDYMNLEAFKNRAPHYCSGGEKKRITIADIIAMHSEVIIFDEPTAALDPLNAVILEEVLGKLVDQGKTLLISTHDMDFAYRWAKRLLVFADGEIIADGTPETVFADDAIRIKANLKKPMLLDVYESMVSRGLAQDTGAYPKNILQFEKWLDQVKA